MAAAVEAHWPAGAALSGLVVTRYRHSLPTRRIEVVEASHPLPDGRGEAAALRMLALAGQLTPDDLLLALISGGGSSLLAAPVEGVTLQALRQVTRALLRAGADIHQINTVRKHLTRLAGGQLARAAQGAPGLALILSDVVGDDPSAIASGPCSPDPSRCADALACLRRFRIVPPVSVARHLDACAAGQLADTPKPGDPCFAAMRQCVIGSAGVSLAAAAGYFAQRGVRALVLSERVSGDAAQAAGEHAALVGALRGQQAIALISGGETTVALPPRHGRGGRNTEFLLALALALDGAPVWALACDTDGLDGSADHAGALIGPTTLARAHALGIDLRRQQARHDSYGAFSALGDLVFTGPTRTNVNDFRVLLVNNV
jgi:hydroxypyruvate reductase